MLEIVRGWVEERALHHGTGAIDHAVADLGAASAARGIAMAQLGDLVRANALLPARIWAHRRGDPSPVCSRYANLTRGGRMERSDVAVRSP